MRDDLDDAIAAEQHRNGRAWLGEPEHCEGCAEVDRAWAQAVCEHENWVDLTTCGGHSERLCNDCGMKQREKVSA